MNNDKRTPYAWPDVEAPVAEVKAHERIIHGDTVTDNYYWLNDFFKKGPDSTKVVDYLNAENSYLEKKMEGIKPLREKLFTELKGRVKEQDESVPYLKNGYYYYSRTDEGKEYFKYCRKKGSLDAEEEVILDVDAMAEGYAYYDIGALVISDDNNLLAYSVDTVSRRQYAIYTKNLTTGETGKDVISGTNGGVIWSKDSKHLFYTVNNPATLLSEKIFRHPLGDVQSNDVLVYQERDPTNYIGVGRTKSGNYIYIVSQSTMSSEVRYISADNPTAVFTVFQPRQKNVLYSIQDHENTFYIRTNLDAQNFRLMQCDVNATGVENWKEVIPHRQDVLLEGVSAFKNFLVITERKEGLIQLRIKNFTTEEEHYLDFGEPAYSAGLSNNPEFNTEVLRYGYTSLVTPSSTFDYNMQTKEKTLLKQQEIVGGYQVEDYVTERIYATAKDGKKVPISLVYKKGFKKSGNEPFLLIGYGSYGMSYDPGFSRNRISLLDRGFGIAIAHIRGGEEMGRAWYEDGKLMNKKNTFTDFIACGEHLVAEKYTSPAHLYAQGGSAGGLLMGAITNMAPDLWNGIISDVPFVDVVNTMLDETIPLTTNEYDEWGNPNNKEAYHYIKSYSPYENLEAKNYPNILITTGLHDSQVQYFEPAKYVAKLRTLKKDNNVLFFNTNMEFGHGGASGRFDYLKEVALEYAFLFALEGITE